MSADYVPSLGSNTLASRRAKFASAELSLSENAINTPRKGFAASFRDTVIRLEEEDCAADDPSTDDPSPPRLVRSVQERSKLIIILVGLPGRGKTFLANKCQTYLQWCAVCESRTRARPPPPSPTRRSRVREAAGHSVMAGGTVSRTRVEHCTAAVGAVLAPSTSVTQRAMRCYSCWKATNGGACRLGHKTRHFNVGSYRRQIKNDEDDAQDSRFFDPSNQVRPQPMRCVTEHAHCTASTRRLARRRA